MFNRVARLLKADIHGILDCIEEPELLLQQALRDMEQEQRVLQQNMEQFQQRQQAMEQSIRRYNAELGELEAGLQLCIDQGNDQLARTILRKQLHMQRCCKHLETSLLQSRQELEQMRSHYNQQQQELERARQQYEALQLSEQEPPATSRSMPSDTLIITDADVEVALLKAKATRKAGTSQTNADDGVAL